VCRAIGLAEVEPKFAYDLARGALVDQPTRAVDWANYPCPAVRERFGARQRRERSQNRTPDTEDHTPFRS
jgi:hypothetical protein